MIYPIKTKKKRAAVNKAPLDDGDNMPNIVSERYRNQYHT